MTLSEILRRGNASMSESSRLGDSFMERQLYGSRQANATNTGITELAPNLYYLESFGNVGVVVTDEGVVLIDTGSPSNPRAVLEPLRQLTDKPVRFIIYTHGHSDHAANALPILQEAADRGDARPQIIAHENVSKRMDRYAELHDQQAFINRLQFRIPAALPSFPFNQRFVRPDMTYADQMQFRLGNLSFELHHALGETDDITWVYVPERKVVFSGDLFVSSCPNIGNPLKIQRYEVEWADALEQIAALHAEVLSPGHGPVLRGEAIPDALLTTSKALRYLHDEVVRRLNLGQWQEQIVSEVALPPELANHPVLAPIYGCPAYIVRAIHRRYAGWYDGNPSHLAPSPTVAVASEVVALTGSTALLERAQHLAAEGNYQMALHLLDFVIDGTRDAAEKRHALQLKSTNLKHLAAIETSYISRSILSISAERIEQEAMLE